MTEVSTEAGEDGCMVEQRLPVKGLIVSDRQSVLLRTPILDGLHWWAGSDNLGAPTSFLETGWGVL